MLNSILARSICVDTSITFVKGLVLLHVYGFLCFHEHFSLTCSKRHLGQASKARRSKDQRLNIEIDSRAYIISLLAYSLYPCSIFA